MLTLFFYLLYLDSTKYERIPVVRTRPAIKKWSSLLMGQRQDLELKEEVMVTLKLHEEWTEYEVPENEGFIHGGSSDTSFKEARLILCFLFFIFCFSGKSKVIMFRIP